MTSREANEISVVSEQKERKEPPPVYVSMVDPFLVEALQNHRHRLTSKFVLVILFVKVQFFVSCSSSCVGCVNLFMLSCLRWIYALCVRRFEVIEVDLLGFWLCELGCDFVCVLLVVWKLGIFGA